MDRRAATGKEAQTTTSDDLHLLSVLSPENGEA
jgi:hypothetical protein